MGDVSDIAVIGGGAAGLAASVAAARAARRLGTSARVVLYEADDRVGRSILATGNGRCNFSNAHVHPEVYRNADFVGRALSSVEEAVVLSEAPSSSRSLASCGARSCANAVQAFFASLGLVWREEAEGRLYPLANKASSVLDVLRFALDDYGVEQRCGCSVSEVEAPLSSGGRGERFTIHLADGALERADAVVVACGGGAARRMLPDDIGLLPSRPVLGPLETDARMARQLDNVRVRCEARLVRPTSDGGDVDGGPIAHESGEVLFRKYGLSGIAVFNLSRFARPGDLIRLDLLPFLDVSGLEAYALERYEQLAALGGGGLTCGGYLRGLVLPRIAQVVLKEIGLDDDRALAKDDASRVLAMLKKLDFEVRGMADERQCQVRRGGFDVAGFDARTMQSLAVPGLFVAGEALDVDAPCGGYNLHWAWASGMLAGENAVRCMRHRRGSGD